MKKEKEKKAIPDSIKICGITFQIEQVPVVDKGSSEYTMGMIDFTKDQIQVDQDLPEDKKLQVLIHEIMHAVFDLTGNQDLCDNENTVQSVATALFCILQENDLLRFL